VHNGCTQYCTDNFPLALQTITIAPERLNQSDFNQAEDDEVADTSAGP